ncbi:MAG: mechanosensitive ion channel family protein [Coleofasciculaceae cyanobacterium SM2_3_26]|nr:mechanosensitive ion channel family protein [Coleofasciculaceae cyanobacterium SM2_3_26]
MLDAFLEWQIFSNTIASYLMAIVLFLFGVVCIAIFEQFILRLLKQWARKTANVLDDKLIEICELGSVPLLYIITFNLSVRILVLPPVAGQTIEAISIIAIAFFAVRAINTFIRHTLANLWYERSGLDRATLRSLLPSIQVFTWVLGGVFVLDNLGFSISATMAGLGIGGVVVALASQGVLEDLFSYFAILLDRPFELGDFIVVEDYAGSVENIGIKTTRIRSIGGEQLIISNKNLTDSRIQNYKRMERRRVAFCIGVVYETTKEQLEGIPALIESIVAPLEYTVFDRAHFAAYGDASLLFEIVYYVLGNNYDRYMDIQQTINLALKEAFERRGIEFASPTRSPFLSRPTD